MPIELEAGLDDPDGVRRGARHDTRDGGGGEVDPGVLLAVVEVVGDDLLAVPVGEEDDGPRGYNSDESRTETLEEGARRLFSVYIPLRH